MDTVNVGNVRSCRYLHFCRKINPGEKRVKDYCCSCITNQEDLNVEKVQKVAGG